jgi:cyclophilin family peptidyl-prolyl cis-trans isomerase
MTKQSRQRHLAELRARREAERKAAQRRRARITYGTIAGVVVVVAVAAALIVRGGDDPASPAAPAPEATPMDARADAPSAPAEAACGAKVPPRKPRPTFETAPPVSVKAGERYTANLVTSCGEISIALDAKASPKTISSWVFLASKGYYDSTWFHRIVPGGQAGIGVVQGGDPEGTGTGGPGYNLAEEPPKGRDKPYARYTVAMAKSQAPNSTGSQFFINTQDNSTALQPDYTYVGVVTKGRDVVDKLAAIPTGGQSGDTPQQSAWIEKLTVTKG